MQPTAIDSFFSLVSFFRDLRGALLGPGSFGTGLEPENDEGVGRTARLQHLRGRRQTGPLVEQVAHHVDMPSGKLSLHWILYYILFIVERFFFLRKK